MVSQCTITILGGREYKFWKQTIKCLSPGSSVYQLCNLGPLYSSVSLSLKRVQCEHSMRGSNEGSHVGPC